MFLLLIRILLIWWIAKIIFRMIGRLSTSENRNRVVSGNKKTKADSGIEYTGDIEDADFEEIDNQ